ncbi:MAG: hypothetical protein JW841_03420 [Deltaproteobacteria bacterium]|nr:hypothetical protein [Deltaproteobacteria bacterium]
MKAFLISVVTFLLATAAFAANVTIDNSKKYQKIIGWSGGGWAPPLNSKALQDEIIVESINDLGLNGMRGGVSIGPGNHIQILSWDDTPLATKTWEWDNDDQDPNTDLNTIAWSTSGYATTAADKLVNLRVIPFKNLVEQNGDTFFYFSGENEGFKGGDYGGDVPAWMLYNPGEHIENIISMMVYLRDIHGIKTTYCTVDGEPGYSDPFTPSMVAERTKILVSKYKAYGFKDTKITFPVGLGQKTCMEFYYGFAN